MCICKNEQVYISIYKYTLIYIYICMYTYIYISIHKSMMHVLYKYI